MPGIATSDFWLTVITAIFAPLPQAITPAKVQRIGGLKTPNGVPLASFGYFKYQKLAGCPSNNWHPTPQCEGQTYDYVRRVLGYYLTYKQHPELIGKTVAPAPSTVARHRGRV